MGAAASLFVKLGLVPGIMGEEGEPDFYTMATQLFSSQLYSIIYVVLIALLGFHLYHAFQSGFQTLGLDHNKYNKVIKMSGLVYSLVVSCGFAIIPLYFLMTNKG